MNLSVMGKISTVFKYLFSSFISLNLAKWLNDKKKNPINTSKEPNINK
ncbi:MAG: hypothetical protein IJ880_16945 [Bacilli bacterium]|nr:hypothetical protein [Bacilli bacterium]